MILVMLADRN